MLLYQIAKHADGVTSADDADKICDRLRSKINYQEVALILRQPCDTDRPVNGVQLASFSCSNAESGSRHGFHRSAAQQVIFAPPLGRSVSCELDERNY